MSFRLAVKYKAGCIEGVENFKYLGQVLDRSDDDCPAVRRYFWKANQVWNQLRK